MEITEKYKGHIALTIAYVIFGLNMPVAKDVLSSGWVSAWDLTLLRMFGGTLLFWAVSLIQPREKVQRIDLFKLFFASLFGISINQSFFITGLSLTSPVNAGIISTCGPIITMLLAALFLREPITWLKGIGVAIGATGALLLILGGSHLSDHPGEFRGDVLCVLSSLSFAVYLTLFKPLINRYSPATVMKWMFLYATICCAPFGYKNLITKDFSEIPYPVVAEVAYVVVMATFLAYLLVPVGQRLLRPTVVSMYNYLQPLMAAMVAVAMGLDVFGWKKALAAALVFFGVWVVTKSKSRAQLDAERRYNG